MIKNSPDRRERIGRSEVGVREEVSRLVTTLSWGPAGVEAILAILIPEEKSLFMGKMDVMLARRQYEGFQELLEQRGCKVISVRDLAAKALLDRGGTMPSTDLVDLRLQIIKKANSLIQRYGRGIGEMVDCIAEVLAEDAERYGEEAAIRLNAELAQVDTDRLPMANLLFGRDQSNVVGDRILWSKMTHDIRQPEVDLWMLATEQLLANVEKTVVSGDGRLEGGDTIVHNGDCLVGVGGRTNILGVEQIAPVVFSEGFRLFAVHHPERAAGRLEHQTTMHLDTFYMPGPKNTVVVLPEEASDRVLMEAYRSCTGGIRFEERGTFADYLEGSGADIIPLTREQQLDYQANLVVLDENSVMLTVTGDGYLKREFERRGVEVVDGNLDAITPGYGGAHCSLTPILRV